MNIREELLVEHSKHQSYRIRDHIGNNPHRHSELIQLVLSNENIVAQRASWTMSHCFDLRPNLITQHISDLLSLLNENKSHVAIKRNILRIAQTTPIPPTHIDDLINNCFNYLQDRQETTGVKMFALVIISNILPQYPDLGRELTLILEDQLDHVTVGFKSKAKKVLIEIKKLNTESYL